MPRAEAHWAYAHVYRITIPEHSPSPYWVLTTSLRLDQLLSSAMHQIHCLGIDYDPDSLLGTDYCDII